MSVVFFEHEVKSRLKNKRVLSGYISQLIQQKHTGVKKVMLNYVFCDNAYLHQINVQFLEHDTFTDVITFDYGIEKGRLNGEIYISTQMVEENAAKFQATYADELLRVIFHGALHLCGYKDKTEADLKQMRTREEECIASFKKALAA